MRCNRWSCYVADLYSFFMAPVSKIDSSRGHMILRLGKIFLLENACWSALIFVAWQCLVNIYQVSSFKKMTMGLCPWSWIFYICVYIYTKHSDVKILEIWIWMNKRSRFRWTKYMSNGNMKRPFCTLYFFVNKSQVYFQRNNIEKISKQM